MSSTQASNEQPRYFYKYGRVDCYTKRIFEANELYFSTIDEFNDPFDCYHGLGLCGTRKEVREYLNKLSKANHSQLSRNDRRSWVNKCMKNCKLSNGRVSFEFSEEMIKDSTKNWRVYCLSETCENIQMWAHYADGHKGFCLKFLNAENEPLVVGPNSDAFKYIGMAPMQVQYSDRFPIINRILDDDRTSQKKACLTKASGWSYEKEWRMVDTGGPGPRCFSPRFLKSVIFGCKMSGHHKQQIRKLCEGRDPAVTFHEARISLAAIIHDVSRI